MHNKVENQEKKWGPAPKPPGFIAFLAQSSRKRKAGAVTAKTTTPFCSAFRIGARVASQRCPILRADEREPMGTRKTKQGESKTRCSQSDILTLHKQVTF
jgi:hypothetical protein